MIDRHGIAELLAAIWCLGGAANERLPTSHGVLDRALYKLRNELPSTITGELTFSETNVGLRCLQLPAILLAAQEALLTSEPNPTYISTLVTLDDDGARQIAYAAGLSTRDARHFGEMLRKTSNEIRSQAAFSSHAITG